MKILIVGTGMIGTIYGQVLSAQNEVFHYVRTSRYSEKNNKTIHFDYIDERRKKNDQNINGSYQYSCVTAADSSYDLIIVPVKTFQLIETMKELAKQAPKAKYLIFTLDWNQMDQVDRIISKDQYIVGYAGGGGTFKGDLLWGNVGKDIMLGTIYPEQQPILKNIDQVFRVCGIIPEVPQNALHWLWMHNVSTAPFGAALAKHRDFIKYLDDKELIKVTFGACRECCLILKARGVNLKQFPESKMYTMPSFLYFIPIAMMRWNFKKNPVMQRYTAHANDSLDEMCLNFEEIYQTGRELEINMPNMDFLHKIVEKNHTISCI
ncbi:ketopantoate reductase [Paenibacillus marchantiophytorum]|uniref:Ketopantoate reductase n=1 Tax=Paenibacillus marchantiophytorum TaxID=1619310 RepID=A0ABQ1EY82_9BACL|nr:ketopantoate reductase family protein [Paenibacillus marchantiophytorum]GFZ92516.1 ketopantoate reductase [Paenibacillus marchantiophytorum]